MMSSTRMTTGGTTTARRHAESAAQVRETRRAVEPVLLGRRPHALEARHDLQAGEDVDGAGQELRLVVAALSTALRVHRHRHQGTWSRDGQQRPQGRQGGPGEDRSQAGGPGVLQRGEGAAHRPAVGKGRQRQHERVADDHGRISADESVIRPPGRREGAQTRSAQERSSAPAAGAGGRDEQIEQPHGSMVRERPLPPAYRGLIGAVGATVDGHPRPAQRSGGIGT